MAAWVNIVLKCVDGGPLMCVMLVLREERDKTLPLLVPSASGLNVEGDDWTSSATDDRGTCCFFPDVLHKCSCILSCPSPWFPIPGEG